MADPRAATSAHSRLLYLVGIVLVMLLGLASREFPGLFPEALGKYPGDALWALMVFLGWGLLWPNATTIRLGLWAAITAAVIETAQLYQAPWIQQIRATTLGHLVLGSTFAWANLVAYAVGILVGMVLRAGVRARRTG